MNTENYWTNRYKEKRTGWDIGQPSTPLKEYIDQLIDKDLQILIPGAGNAYEAEYLWNKGFKNIYILDISNIPLETFKKRNPSFPSHQLICDDFFKHKGQYDLILEQTFFCSFPPSIENRTHYALQMHNLLTDNGKLVGLWFDIPLTDITENRPFGGDKMEYVGYLSPYFNIKSFNLCYNSIPERKDEELFGLFIKK